MACPVIIVSWVRPVLQVHCQATTHHPSGPNNGLQRRLRKKRLDLLLKLVIKTTVPGC